MTWLTQITMGSLFDGKCIINASCSETHHLIRRLTPLECERLQGFPDGWTDIPGASDSARYKALGNSGDTLCGVYYVADRRGHAGGIASLLVSPLFHAASSLALVIAFALAFGYLSFTIKKIGRNCHGRKNAQPLR